MSLVYAYDGRIKAEDAGKPIIFLAGPSLSAGPNVKFLSWRNTPIEILEKRGNCVIVVPETPDGLWQETSVKDQVAWEEGMVKRATVTMFWVPRSDELPGLTTNIEWGRYCLKNGTMFGAPASAKSVERMIYDTERFGIPRFEFLEDLAHAAYDKAVQIKETQRTSCDGFFRHRGDGTFRWFRGKYDVNGEHMVEDADKLKYDFIFDENEVISFLSHNPEYNTTKNACDYSVLFKAAEAMIERGM